MLDFDRPLKDQLTELGIEVRPCSGQYRSLYADDGRHLGDFTARTACERFDQIVATAFPTT